MKSTIEQLTRQLYIVNRLLRSNEPVATDVLLDDIGRQCEIRSFTFPIEHKSQMRLLQRDIQAIEEMFYITIANKRGVGYYIKERDEDSPMDYDRFVTNFDMLSALTPDSQLHRYVLPERNRYIGSNNFYPLLKAIKDHRVVEFNYTNIRTGLIKHHRVTPYFLKEDQMRWYLVGMQESGKTMLFGIDRINDLIVSDEKFIRNTEIDGSTLFEDCYGIWNDDSSPVENVILKYDSLDGSFLKSVPLHHSQKIIKDTEGEFVISLNIKITNDFVMALLSRSRSLEVIEPAHLRERIKSIYKEALQRNK